MVHLDSVRQVIVMVWLCSRHTRVPVYGHGETGMLAESFNTMVETLEETQQELDQVSRFKTAHQFVLDGTVFAFGDGFPGTRGKLSLR